MTDVYWNLHKAGTRYGSVGVSSPTLTTSSCAMLASPCSAGDGNGRCVSASSAFMPWCAAKS